MGLRFRKSFGSGPFKVNLSKSGVSYSIGTKGARVTKKAGGGVRTSVGTGGVYYTKDFGGGNVSRRRKAKKKGGCLTWVAGFIGVLAVFGITLGACSPEEPETNIPEETPAIIEEQEPAAEPVAEEQPKEKEVIEFEPVFIGPFTGERSDGETTEPPIQETPIADDPVVESVVEQPIEDTPVVESPEPVVGPDPITTPVVQPDPVTPPVVEPDPVPQGQIVYITEHGTKYHRAGCRHLQESCIEVTLEYAQNNQMEACKNCH